jgi:hypothetical protein
MEIKNTILRKVNTAQDFWYNAEQGFDYINVDSISDEGCGGTQEHQKSTTYVSTKTWEIY